MLAVNHKRNETFWAIFGSVVFAFVGLIGVAIASYSVPVQSKTMAVILPVTFNEQDSFDTISKLNGSILRFGATSNVVIAHFNDKTPEDVLIQSDVISVLNPVSIRSCISADLEGQYLK